MRVLMKTTMVQKNTWRTAARKCVYQDQLWRGAVGKILSVVSGPPILKLALLLKLFLMLVYQFKDIGIEHIFNGSRLKPIMRYVFWLILDERYWLEKKHSFPQGESLSCEAEDLGKTWQSFVALFCPCQSRTSLWWIIGAIAASTPILNL